MATNWSKCCQVEDPMTTASCVNLKNSLNACVVVSDLEAGIAWYRRVLGFELYQRHRYGSFGVEVAYLQREALEIELVEPPEPKPCHRDDPPGGHFAWRGISQLSFRVTDIDAAVQQLEEQAVAIVFGPLYSEEFNLKACFIRDCDDNLIEFIQRM
ncbi:MAG: VOC family protein [Candidatus Thiodiazotropha sp.]